MAASLVRSPEVVWSDQHLNLGLGPVKSVLSISEESLTSGSGEDRVRVIAISASVVGG
jgi:hypothetical protein